MSTRREHIESIMGDMQTIKRKLMSHRFAKTAGAGTEQITPSQWAVLSLIVKNESLGIKELAKMLGITSSATTQLIDELVKKGYVIREGNADDRRALALKLSDKHRKRMTKLMSQAIGQVTTIFEILNDKELAQYAMLHKKIAKNIR